ncbi:lung adenoma susceptibility protein 2 [Rhineura floridana]|uniref:lung adenoma susceptibility protein 2 n=1 Tax=Rhineura floridana TaxID=261503 RepID=UPI002AC844B3|nr:lung adenoma susceptibility protein 2 [Rhineura floridana]XP_061470715.1 lung adenoma susceptibility protein 2 [Rhineura floridana]XP_061470724.1 lung adenoma susceptibility protein 2 [Rhineura floridana]
MACLIKKGNIYSPESTVSSLLADCSLSNSSGSLNSHSSIQYKHKLYRSASQALEAYIEDFDLSLASSEVRPGKICITQSTPKNLRSSKDSFKHKYALENFKQQAALGSVAPYLRRKAAYDPDMLSLTTDDLLTYPADGSVSFIHAAAFRSVPKGINLNRKSLISSASCAHQTSSFGNKEELNFPKYPAVSPSYKQSSRNVHAQQRFHKHHSRHSLKNQLIEEDDSESVFHKNYPRWLTSQKSDLSVSGISSIPDFEYPIWLKSHNLLPDSSNESSTWTPDAENNHTFLQNSKTLISSQNVDRTNNPGCFGHNGFLCLQNEHEVQRNSQNSQGLGEQKYPLTDDDTELLLQKVKRNLESSADELTNVLKNDGSPCTVDILEAERSWDNVPFGLKSPVPVYCEEETCLQNPKASIVNEFLEDCLKNDRQENTFSGGNHHGPVETLKLMLFNLQAVQRSFNVNKTAGQKEEFKKISDEDVEFKLCDRDIIPVRKSLQRALHHLSRLKGLVEDTGGNEEPKESIKT